MKHQKGFANIAFIIGILVIAGIAGYFVLSLQTTISPVPTPTPTSTSTTPTQTPTTESGSSTITVSLGEEFTLKKGETAQVNGLSAFLKVNDFIYSPCPKGLQCIWSGLDVIYDLTVDGKVYGSHRSDLDNPPHKTLYEAPYDVLVKGSDYKTYATFAINKPEVSCAIPSGILKDECWQGLAKRFNDQAYCNRIENLTIKDACFEDLAESAQSN